MASVKIPKRVGGVKIPKKVRRRVKKAVKVAKSPVIREVAAAALGAAAQARSARSDARAERRERSVAPEVLAPDAPTRPIGKDRVFETIRAAALDGLRRFMEGLDEGLRDLEREAKTDGAEPARRANGRRGGAAAE